MTALIVDFEYTTWPGALESGWGEDWQHREIVQIGVIAVNDDFIEELSMDFLIKPAINQKLSDLFVSLTGITQEQVDRDGKPPHAIEGLFRLQSRIQMLGWPETNEKPPIICMNADEGVMRENYKLAHMTYPLCKPWHRLRPFLEAQGVDLSAISTSSSRPLWMVTRTMLFMTFVAWRIGSQMQNAGASSYLWINCLRVFPNSMLDLQCQHKWIDDIRGSTVRNFMTLVAKSIQPINESEGDEIWEGTVRAHIAALWKANPLRDSRIAAGGNGEHDISELVINFPSEDISFLINVTDFEQ